MTRPQGDAAALLRGAHAMTDVTGFGLAGHLHGILMASGKSAELRRDAIPLLDGALELAAQGQRSTLYPKNRDAVPGLVPQDPLGDLLFDPQTAGGLLACHPNGEEVVEALRGLGYAAAVIGRITGDWPGHITLV
jgi:selenide,water dikinase